MHWNTPTEADVLNRFTPQEQATLKNVQGAVDLIPSLLADQVAAAQGKILVGGYSVGPAGTLPDQIKPEVMALVRWELIGAFPALKVMATEIRKEAAEKASKLLDSISRHGVRIESPTAGITPASGQWNSEAKLIMRTHPIPDPATQFQQDVGEGTGYANPTGPADA